ncbi:MAG: protein kinase domain-containing protein [Bryobacteraceae bacterium]
MIGQTVSHYRILSQLGQGGMGVVYLAEDTHLGRRVAVKFSTAAPGDSLFRARFLREARVACALNHPHIAGIYDYGETADGQPFLVMELVEGESLLRLLHSGPLPLVRILGIVESVAEALGEAHRQGIVHRDIKPSNIMLTGRGEVKVLDFGLAKQLDQPGFAADDSHGAGDADPRTVEGTVMGTPLYMSPEQARGAPVDGRSDLFSLGAVLYECLAGRAAFRGANAVEILAQVIHLEPTPPSEVNPLAPKDLDRLTQKALAKKPEARYQSADEVLADLRVIHATLTAADSLETQVVTTCSTPRASTLQSLVGSLRPSRMKVALVMAVFLVAAAAWWLWLRLPYQPSPEALRWYQEGSNALRDGTYFKASKALERAVSLDPGFPLTHARLAEAWTELDQGDKAKEELLRAISPESNPRLSRPDNLYLQAVRLTLTNDFAGAVEKYREILRRAPDAEQPAVLVDLGRAYDKNDKPKEALDTYREAARRDPQLPAAFLRAGALYGRQLDPAKAGAAFDQAESLYRAHSNIEGVTEVTYQRGLLSNRLGRIGEARTALEKALEMARAAGNLQQQIPIMLGLSNVAFTEGDTAQAQQLATDAIGLARSNRLENLTTRGLASLGNVHQIKGDLDQAAAYFSQALDTARQFHTVRLEMRASLSLASVYIQRGELDAGLRHLDPALAYFQQAGYRQETAQALILSIRAKRQKGDYEGAFGAAGQQLRLAQQADDHAQMALADEALGSILSLEERFSEALARYQQSYALNKAGGNQAGMGYTQLNSAHQLWRLGRYQEAREQLRQVEDMAKRPGGDKLLLGSCYLQGAEMELSLRHAPEAMAGVRQALAAAGSQDAELKNVSSGLALGLAQILAGAKREGRVNIEAALAAATASGKPALISQALLARAQALVETGDAAPSAETALAAAGQFARAGQYDSEWRAWAVAARAARSRKDQVKEREFTSHAVEALSKFLARLDPADRETYLARPDVQHDRSALPSGRP